MRSWRLIPAFILMIGACGTGGDGDSLESVSLADTRLAGGYSLVDYLFEYGDGVRLDPSVLTVTGTLAIGEDSSYQEGIRVADDSTPTTGKITRLKANSSRDAGELELTLAGGDGSAKGITAYAFRGDTLILITEVSKARDVSGKGFRETAYYFREKTAPGE